MDNINSSENSLTKLMTIHTNIDWSKKKAIRCLLGQLLPLLKNWSGPLPNFRDFLRTEQIDSLLIDLVKCADNPLLLIEFIISTGYTDQPNNEEPSEEEVSDRRTTALHHVLRRAPKNSDVLVEKLFKIYRQSQRNYKDGNGFTHFHVACKHGCEDEVQKFLEAGQDPNILVPDLNLSPLHLSIGNGKKKITEVLMQANANPNLLNANRRSALHILCIRGKDDELVTTFFKSCDEFGIDIQIDAKDNQDRTALQLSVANLMPHLAGELLNRGANILQFAFPTAIDLGSIITRPLESQKIRLAAALNELVHRLQKYYILDYNDIVKIVIFTQKFEIFSKPSDYESWFEDDEDFDDEVKKTITNLNQGLYDLMRTNKDQANNMIQKLYKNKISRNFKQPFVAHLCDIVMQNHFRKWSRDFFYLLIHANVSLECCDMILKHLSCADLCNVIIVGNGLLEQDNNKSNNDGQEN